MSSTAPYFFSNKTLFASKVSSNSMLMSDFFSSWSSWSIFFIKV
jgi:hypothetical protein